MEFVVFLMAYVVRRKLDQAGMFDSAAFWRNRFSLAQTVRPGMEANLWRGVLLVSIPALLLATGEVFLRSADWSVIVHPLAFILLILLMGTPGLAAMLDHYTRAWARGDMQSAWLEVRDFLPAEDRGSATSPEQMHRSLSRRLIALIFERYFVIAFWYLVAGIAGAFIARALMALRDHWPHAAARPGYGRLADWLNFLPARLLGLTFGIAGDLSGWLKYVRPAMGSVTTGNTELLMTAASGSLSGYELEPERFVELHPQEWPAFGERSLAAVRGLLNRSMLVWICLLAVLVIAGVI